MINIIKDLLRDRNIVILGFGREGISTYRFIRKHLPDLPLTITDQSELINKEEIGNDPNLVMKFGPGYADGLNDYDLVIKTPGVNLNRLPYLINPQKITSQTELFLKAFSPQTIGITGTKGKSTTASLLYHIIKHAGRKVLLAGNIGIPFLDIADKVDPDTMVVAELSAHQLEFLQISPHIAVILNIFQEHLDHFSSFNNYQLAKLNIANFQNEKDYLIYNYDDLYIPKLLESHHSRANLIPFSRNTKVENGAYCYGTGITLEHDGEAVAGFDLKDLHHLPGQHNFNNVMAAILAANLLNIDNKDILNSLKTYKSLPHRIEYVGKFQGIHFYNDSIATIPEATIAAVKTIRKVDTLILGGYDRGIEYTELIRFLAESNVSNIVFTGMAGQRIFNEWKNEGVKLPESYLIENDYRSIAEFCYSHTQAGKACLLSPAASSYDQFKNFEERGDIFKKEVLNIDQLLTKHSNQSI